MTNKTLMLWQFDSDNLEDEIEKAIQHALSKYAEVLSVQVPKGLKPKYNKYPTIESEKLMKNWIYIEVEKHDSTDS